MFDETFNRWIVDGQLSLDDIVTVLIEYNQTFRDGKITSDQIIQMIQQDPRVQMCDFIGGVCRALTLLGIHKGKQWITVTDDKGNIIKRFWNESISSK